MARKARVEFETSWARRKVTFEGVASGKSLNSFDVTKKSRRAVQRASSQFSFGTQVRDTERRGGSTDHLLRILLVHNSSYRVDSSDA